MEELNPGVTVPISELGISIDKVTQQLEDQGVEEFNKRFDKLLETLAKS